MIALCIILSLLVIVAGLALTVVGACMVALQRIATAQEKLVVAQAALLDLSEKSVQRVERRTDAQLANLRMKLGLVDDVQ